MQHLALDRWSRGASSVHRRDARAKIIALLVFLVALATARRELVPLACGLLLLLLSAVLWARIPLLGALARASLVLPFTILLAAIRWIAGDPAASLALLIKSYLSALAVVLVAATTPLPLLLQGIERMGAPRFLLQVAQFVYRYLFVISEEARHMSRAARSRGASARQWIFAVGRFRAAAGALAVLFARSYARAGHVHQAMLARGFSGSFPLLETSRFRLGDFLFTAAAAALIVALRIFVEARAR